MPDFDPDREDVIQRAFSAGVKAILVPAEITDANNLRITQELTLKFPNIIAAAGIHPHQAKDMTIPSTELIKTLAANREIHAVGEIGLDFHYNHSSPAQQIQAYRTQLQIAQQVNLPVVIHSRLAADEILLGIKEEKFTCGGVLHCFTEDWGFARQVMEYGFFISFSGILTFPQAHSLREVARRIPGEKLMVETDSPFLAPVPYRGKIKRNEPVYVKETLKYLADLKEVSLAGIAAQTTANFEKCFGFEIKHL